MMDAEDFGIALQDVGLATLQNYTSDVIFTLLHGTVSLSSPTGFTK